MQQVELVPRGIHFLLPIPLGNGGFNEGCWSIGVVFKQLGRADAVITKIEAAEQRGGIGMPGVDDVFFEPWRQREGFKFMTQNNAGYRF